jgi:hypothetical protein
MTAVLLLLAILAGAVASAILLVPRLPRASESARASAEAERAARLELDADVERCHAELETDKLQSQRDAEDAARSQVPGRGVGVQRSERGERRPEGRATHRNGWRDAREDDVRHTRLWSLVCDVRRISRKDTGLGRPVPV